MTAVSQAPSPAGLSTYQLFPAPGVTTINGTCPEAALSAMVSARPPQSSQSWWLPSVLTFIGLGAFVAYSTWAAFQGNHYRFDHYLSPMYSPELFGSAKALFGPIPSWIPSWLPFSPALLILWAPGGFRITCYYYRGAYYKAFWADPPNCTVGEPRKNYLGEKYFPLVESGVGAIQPSVRA